jgi:hypothetical protein
MRGASIRLEIFAQLGKMGMTFHRLAKQSRWIVLATLSASLPLLWVLPLAGICGLVLTLFLIVARFDNDAGAFVPLAVLGVIVLLVIALLLAGLAYVHALMASG